MKLLITLFTVLLFGCSEKPDNTPESVNKYNVSSIWIYQDTTDANTIVKCYQFNSGGASCVVIGTVK